MSDTPGTARERLLQGLRTPWGMAAILLALLLLVYAYQAWREGDLQAAFASYTPFTTPAFELEFSSAFPYDPLSFVGRGERADFWKWSQDGLVLTDHGRQFFEESGEKFVSRTAAGTRRVTRITGRRPVAAGQQIDFFYEWTEVSAPASALMAPPPRVGEEYLGQAVLARDGDRWTVQSLTARDFEEPLAHLQAIASGVRR